MHEVKKPFAGIKKLIWHGKPFFLKIKLLKKPFFSQSRVDSLNRSLNSPYRQQYIKEVVLNLETIAVLYYCPCNRHSMRFSGTRILHNYPEAKFVTFS